MLLIELMCIEGHTKIINIDGPVIIEPMDGNDGKSHTLIDTPAGMCIALKPYGEIRDMLMQEVEDDCFFPYEHDQLVEPRADKKTVMVVDNETGE